MIVDVLVNDVVLEGSILEVIMELFNGCVRVMVDNWIVYMFDFDFVGMDELVYQVCCEGCVCVDVVLWFIVGEGVDCEFLNIFMLNGDGVNEVFIILCLLDIGVYLNSQFFVFNCWGDEVYNLFCFYLNNWCGIFNGEDLLVDIYFYILDFGDGSWLIIGYFLFQK